MTEIGWRAPEAATEPDPGESSRTKPTMITFDEWDEIYGQIPNADGDYSLLEDTPEVRSLLEQHDQHYVWSQIDGGKADRGLVVPGFSPSAYGYHLTAKPWNPDKPVVAEIVG